MLRNGGLAESYQYDQQGRRSHEINAFRGNLNRRFQYDRDNRLLMAQNRAGNTAYEHDQHGFRSAKREQDGRTTLYRYAPDGRLLGAELADGDVVIYGHDAQGRRTAKEVNGLPVERYAWVGDQDRTRLNRAIVNGVVLEFLYGADRLPELMLRDGVAYYLYYDQVGSLRLVADELGNAVKELVYDSFGNILEDTNPALRIPMGFAGGLHDPDTGLVRFGFRDYDPDTGRFTALDPLGYAGGDSDLYGYCLDDPVNLVDPSGLQPLKDMPEAYLEFDPSMEQIKFKSDNSTDYYEAKNDVTGDHTPIEAGAYQGDVVPKNIDPQDSYGPSGTYIDTQLPDGKDIHGGGSDLKHPQVPRQGWEETHGCIRMQNEDAQELSRKINEYKERAGKPVPFFTTPH